MKKIYTIIMFLIALSAFSQAPKYINYQGAARYSNGRPITKPLNITFKIFSLTPQSPAYSETQSNISPNALGIFNTQIGKGKASGITGVAWGKASFSLEVTIDTTQNTQPMVLGIQQLVSVPYAMHADSAANISWGFNNGALTIGDKTLPTTSINSAGATTVTSSGNVYTINTPSVVTAALDFPIITPFGTGSGLAQVIKSGTTYSVAVAPLISYTNSTGLLYITENPAITTLATQFGLQINPASYSYTYNITPIPGLLPNGSLYIGPTTNAIDLTPVAPWRTQAGNPTTATLTSGSSSVGIGMISTSVSAKMHVDGYTKLGLTAPAIGIVKLTGTMPLTAGGSTSIPLPQLTINTFITQIVGSKVLSVSLLVDDSAGQGFIPPNYTELGNYEYNWRISGNDILITAKNGNRQKLKSQSNR
jgi:hypothetical protein